MKKIILLGASGSIGQQTLEVLATYPDQFCLIGFSVGKRIAQVDQILKNFQVEHICVQNEFDANTLKQKYPNITFYHGDLGLSTLAALPGADTLVNALVGFVGLVPTLEAIQTHKQVALANKETLIVGGRLVKQALEKYQGTLTPIDSEHSAIFQCLQGNNRSEVSKIIITASGGSFRQLKREQLKDVTLEAALAHPNWAMGSKITIDSATLMNKGFEVIEAHYLFDMDYDDIDVLIHHESIVHSLVEYQDHALIAQLGTADMRLPIQYALTYPNRLPLKNSDSLDLASIHSLHFEHVDEERYPFLRLAYEMGRKEGNACAIMNAANEIAVANFIAGKISFLDIERLVFKAIEVMPFIQEPTLGDIIESDTQTREYVTQCVRGDY